jgi:hypothetical protein
VVTGGSTGRNIGATRPMEIEGRRTSLAAEPVANNDPVPVIDQETSAQTVPVAVAALPVTVPAAEEALPVIDPAGAQASTARAAEPTAQAPGPAAGASAPAAGLLPGLRLDPAAVTGSVTAQSPRARVEAAVIAALSAAAGAAITADTRHGRPAAAAVAAWGAAE